MKKLFDIQTGEYLELGTDWLDGGEYIEVWEWKEDQYLEMSPDSGLPPIKIEWTEFSEGSNYSVGQFVRKDNKGYIVDDAYNLYPYGFISRIKVYKNPTHKLNTEWNTLFKNCVYGDRYVKVNYWRPTKAMIEKMDYVDEDNYIATIWRTIENLIAIERNKAKPIYHYTLLRHIRIGVDSHYLGEYCGNLLEEYSKFTRDEENKLLEFEKLLGFNK